MARPEIRTDRLVLVPQTVQAARALLDGRDPGLSLAAGYPHADTFDGLRLELMAGDPDGLGWFATLAEDGRVIGDGGTHGWHDGDGRVEIGYGLAAPSRGRGLGTELAAAIADWVAAQPDVTAVVASVDLGNEPSRRLLDRLGFVLVDTTATQWLLERPTT